MKKIMKNVGLFLAAMAVVLLAFKLGMKYELESTKQAVEDEIRLVQEHTAEKVFEMFTNYPSLREDLMNVNAGCKIYRTEIPWWNFDREFTIECDYGEVYTYWCDLQR